jgi:hypothetical protein
MVSRSREVKCLSIVGMNTSGASPVYLRRRLRTHYGASAMAIALGLIVPAVRLACADTCSAFSLAGSESRTFHTGSVYRNVHICNNVLSGGDLTVIIVGRDPIRLAPGMCTTQNGNQVTLNNQASKGSVTGGICQVVGRNR